MNMNEFFAKNWKPLAGVVAAVAVMFGAYSIWKEAKARKEAQASELLYSSQLSARGLVAQKKIPEAAEAYQPVFQKFPNSRAAFEASLLIGDMFMEAGTFDQAAARYDAAVKIAQDSFSRLLARYNLGIAQEAAGKFKEAVASYEEALKSEGSAFLKPEILMAQARCFEALQEGAKAIGIYQTVQKEFANRSYYSGAAAAFEKELAAK